MNGSYPAEIRRAIKLSSVASSLSTVSARAMLAAMIDGETDPLRLAGLARGRMRSKIPDLAQALEGHFDAHHAQLARAILRRLELVEQAVATADAPSPTPAGPGSINWTCCRPSPASERRWRR